MTLKSRLRVIQGNWKRNHCIDHIRLTISWVIWRWILSWSWNVGYRSLKVIKSGTIWKLGYSFLFSFYSKYGRICSHFGDIERRKRRNLCLSCQRHVNLILLVSGDTKTLPKFQRDPTQRGVKQVGVGYS